MSCGQYRKIAGKTGYEHGKPDILRTRMELDPNVHIIDIVGHDEVKRFAHERFKEIYEWYLKSELSHGLLLYGYPGSGKSYTVNAIINDYLTSNNYVTWIEADVSEMTGYVNNTREKVHSYFKSILKHTNKEVVIVIDELEDVIPSQRTNTSRIINARVSGLKEVFGSPSPEYKRLFLLGMTNHPDKIEQAFLRPGRFDDHFFFQLPTFTETIGLIEKYILPIHDLDKEQIKSIADSTCNWAGVSFKNLAYRIEVAKKRNKDEDLEPAILMGIIMKINEQRTHNWRQYREEYDRFIQCLPPALSINTFANMKPSFSIGKTVEELNAEIVANNPFPKSETMKVEEKRLMRDENLVFNRKIFKISNK